jgi:hypothetical protein
MVARNPRFRATDREVTNRACTDPRSANNLREYSVTHRNIEYTVHSVFHKVADTFQTHPRDTNSLIRSASGFLPAYFRV